MVYCFTGYFQLLNGSKAGFRILFKKGQINTFHITFNFFYSVSDML